ncbi:ATP-binding cassette domain-containing protein [Dyadobacter sp. CY356]|uniref:ATP-binding cassette domain-containing protein n=1 Tax=Dyadobacter sp. CY356 TaxID=2906442 RepID=UPI001F2CB137|nr:ATP-binding cassette domain-containing protein [Dyadobacter sp. CY356]MCF0058046.1 ATP-binding cassette domain-containing protein [Dyadobacter sp. CY356]
MVLEIQNLSQRYGSFEVLTIPSWAVDYGIYWVQGENGAGKSTLFRTLAGMLPCSGDIILDQKYNLKNQPVD